MVNTLQTLRLLLRPLAHDDWQAVHAYASDPDVVRYLPEGVMSADLVRAAQLRN